MQIVVEMTERKFVSYENVDLVDSGKNFNSWYGVRIQIQLFWIFGFLKSVYQVELCFCIGS